MTRDDTVNGYYDDNEYMRSIERTRNAQTVRTYVISRNVINLSEFEFLPLISSLLFLPPRSVISKNSDRFS